MKRTLKHKIALALASVTGVAVISSVTMFAISATGKGDAVRSFRESGEYGAIIGKELAAAEQTFDSKEFSLESLGEYYDTVDKIYSLDHAEELTKADKGEYGKAYANAETTNTAAALTMMAAGATFIGGCACSIEIVNPKKKKELVENSFDK